ncbi:hypothetical protein CHGG_04201 [Chaetomium globosum CBS 148.51]|uniref:Uncharacterized protein n=1 Tax=Chaetomium globosum (strain ATCC 6205 / CBS 148.51 / DSM 1962 / NBRC 6347 / NRRL 1970) TaxID=306901 RepID=Q2H1Z5_CHAGB|nr:uncharacterized protein CHGG_04201 [Chaetomium globosum CBS 148.51]EAQ87582.1 hypothetical protein CHGG_04201 [Chaetomium globosum CBS 148.51]
MKYGTALVALAGLASAREINLYSRKVSKREVPQEHSHESILRATNDALQLDNPLEIQDTVFALLGNAAAADGAPNVDNLDCLQQIIADQAFTNAKAAGDLDGQIQAILFRALERNTGSVGLASVLCNETAVNPEIANIQQHQDPASPEASGNAAIELEVAKSLASIGADPLLALQSATFPPGEIGDPTAAGQTCNDIDDANGCIFTLNLLTPAVTEDEIQAAVAGIDAGAGAGGDAGAGAGDDAGAGDACTVIVDPSVDNGAGNAGADNGAGDNATGTVNVQTFTGSLGGVAPPVESTAGSDRPFAVNGATFTTAGAALQRSCSVQKNACANAANSGQIEGGTQQCEAQETECRAANSLKRVRRSTLSRRQANALDFGGCGSPAIQFAVGLDGRKEASFQNVNNADFNHGSAQAIRIIADFTCSRLQSSCNASQETVQACQQASQAAQAATGQAAADAFNSALGVSA